MISLASTLAHNEAVAIIHAQGLDPMIGFLHQPSHGRASLACDLIEPLRPRIEIHLLRALSEQRLRINDFDNQPNGCRLNKHGRIRFYGLWESRAVAIRRYLRLAVHQLLRELCASSR